MLIPMSWPNFCLRRHILATSIPPRVSSRHKLCFSLAVPCIFWPFIPAWEMLWILLICMCHLFCTAKKDHTSLKHQTITHKLYQGNTAAGQSACVSRLWFICTKGHLITEEWRIYHNSPELASFLFSPHLFLSRVETFIMPRSDGERPFCVVQYPVWWYLILSLLLSVAYSVTRQKDEINFSFLIPVMEIQSHMKRQQVLYIIRCQPVLAM